MIDLQQARLDFMTVRQIIDEWSLEMIGSKQILHDEYGLLIVNTRL